MVARRRGQGRQAMRPGATKSAKAFSSGGVVLRAVPDGGFDIVICGRLVPTIWQLPKGTPEKSETEQETALREVTEETGLRVEIVDKIGEVNYGFFSSTDNTRYDKTVSFFLMTSHGGCIQEHDSEFDEVKWTAAETAVRQLTFENESRIVEAAITMATDRETSRP